MKYTLMVKDLYEGLRYEFIKQIEENNVVKLSIYDDKKGNNTIGIGMNLETDAVAIAVTNVIARGFDKKTIDDLKNIIFKGHALSPAALQSALDTKMATYSNAHPELGLRTTYTFANDQFDTKPAVAILSKCA